MGTFAHTPKLMRIAYVHSTGFPSLAANIVQVVQMCRAFAELGHEVTVVIPRAPEYASDEAAREAAHELYGGNLNCSVDFVPPFRLFGRMEVLGTVRGTLAAVRKLRPDLIYTRNPWSVIFLPRAGIPFVFEAHEERAHSTSGFLNRLMRSRIVRATRKPQCALVVCISGVLKEMWEKFGVPPSKLIDAHDGVDLEMFGHEITKTEARKRLGLPSEHPLVVYTGAMRADRGIDLTVDAARALPDLNFVLVGGSAEELAPYRKMVSDYGLSNVRFPGRVSHREIPIWLEAADILLMMWTWKTRSILGSSPMKMFEYMAARRVIVGPAFPTILEVLEDGRDAILFEPDNLDGLIAALRRAAAERENPSLPHAAYNKVSQHYTWTQRCRKILAALDARLT